MSIIRVSSSSPGSSGENEKTMKRKLCNRESAKRSREKRQQLVMDLIKENASLKSINEENKKELEKYRNMDKDLSVLKAEKKLLSYEKAKLEEQLECFKVIIDNYGVQPSPFDHVGFSEPQNPVQLHDVADSSGFTFMEQPFQFEELFDYELPTIDAVASSGLVFQNPWQLQESFSHQLPVDGASSAGSMFQF